MSNATEPTVILSALLRSPRLLVVEFDAEERIVLFSHACELATGYSSEEIEGRTLREALLDPDEANEVGRVHARVVEEGCPLEHVSHWIAKSGERHRIEWTTTPLTDGDGKITNLLAHGRVMTAQQVHSAAELRQNAQRLSRVVEHMPVMMDAFDEMGRIIEWNRECERVTGYTREEILSNPRAIERLYPDSTYRERMMKAWLARGDDYTDWEWDLVAKNGETRTVAWSNISRHAPIAGWATWGIGVDVTERSRNEAHRVLLVNELDHRTKNLLATTLALADQTAEGSSSLEEFQEAFGRRIRTMASVHEALAQSRWEDVEFDVIANKVLAALPPRSAERFALRGDAVRVPATAALPIALCLHELATNAIKHGPLGAAEGAVQLDWHELPSGDLEVLWSESGGPDLAAPIEQGTGLDLVTDLIRYQLAGEVTLAFASPGACARIRLPLARWRSSGADLRTPASGEPS